jgi:CRP-like cAMP-binding protein
MMTYTPDHLNELLSGVSHFRSLPAADRATIIAGGNVRRFAAGTVIFHEGAPCAGLFVLLRGEVHLRKLGPEGQEQIMSVIEPVTMFNEVPVLDGGTNVATAFASQDAVTWHVTYEAFQELLHRYPAIGLGLLHMLARRNRFLISQYEDLSFRSVVARTAKLLLTLSDGGAVAIDRYDTPNTELAARIATVPEAFSRALRHLRGRGYITCTRNTITVVDAESLSDIAAL